MSPPRKNAPLPPWCFPKPGCRSAFWGERTEAEEIDAIRIAQASLAAGEQNLMVQASDNCNCGGTGNCAFWILRQKPGGFDTLLKTNMVQTFSLEPSSSSGHQDVITSAHGSAAYRELALYQFDGRLYRKSRCAGEEYKPRKNGSFGVRPIMTLIDCCTKRVIRQH